MWCRSFVKARERATVAIQLSLSRIVNRKVTNRRQNKQKNYDSVHCIRFWWVFECVVPRLCFQWRCDCHREKQELSYRKQIARQLRKQYVEGISVTLKSRLRVTQGHWKRNHWVDHTRLTISRVIWRWILSWPWNVGQRSLKVIENDTIWKLGYVFLFTFHSNYGRICSHFGDIQPQRMTWYWNLGLGSFKVIENGAIW